MCKIKDTIIDNNKENEVIDFAYWEHLRDLDNEKLRDSNAFVCNECQLVFGSDKNENCVCY